MNNSVFDDSIGYNMYTMPNLKRLTFADLRLILAKDVNELHLEKKEIDDLEMLCNLSKEDLPGKYYDKEGNIYYCFNEQINRFALKIKHFSKIYKSKVN